MHPITDPQLSEGLAGFKSLLPEGVGLEDIPATRDYLGKLLKEMAAQAPPMPGIKTSDHFTPGAEGDPDVMVRIYQPENAAETLPGMLWIHGGGYVLGDVEGDDLKAKSMVLGINCVVAAVEYRLAPEHPYPAPLEDCYAALKWFSEHAAEFGVDPQRIAIGGASAGGGLAAGLGLLARDRGEVDVAYQLLIYPMIDDSNIDQAEDGIADTEVWTRRNNLIGWRSYLGQEPGGEGISQYAAPIRATDLSGLPPTYIGVGTPDLFLKENFTYAQRLIEAGVPTEFHVYRDGFHGFDGFAAMSDAAQRFTSEQMKLVARALHGD
ncbi:MAG: alpha/beta hydrolase [Chloroflexota bacterium]